MKELMLGSSLIWYEEGKERRMYQMHRLVRLFILNDVGRCTTTWNDVHRLALLAVYQDVEVELEKKGNSFYELPDVFEDNHAEFVEHSLALVLHYVHSGRGCENRNISEVGEIHRCTARLMGFMGKSEEEVEVWENLLALLLHQLAEKRRRCLFERLQDLVYRRNREKELKLRIANTYHSLGTALAHTGKFNRAASQLEQSLQIYRAIHGHFKPHLAIASSPNKLGLVYSAIGELKKALEKHERCPKMQRAIHGHRKPHIEIASSLNNLGLVYQDMGELDKALEKYEQSLEMKRVIHGHRKLHLDIAWALNNLGTVYQKIGELDEAQEKLQQSLEIKQTIYGYRKLLPDIAWTLNNLGNLYCEMDELDKALELHEQSMEMYLAILGNQKPHPDFAKSLGNLGDVYHEMVNWTRRWRCSNSAWKCIE